ncbi:MAG TPA: T9SS type A sorting domain-containing protein, partial [Saprospiraceae bacterium]|nr:T9SS type A sorting domain-containing protein [Saprospiraceae bacterium]
RFVDANQKFNNPGNPFEQTIPEVITYDNLQSNKPNTDWVGIKVGDLNLSVTPNNIAGDPQVRNAAETLELTTDDMKLAAGYEYKIPVRAADFKSVQGFQYTLEYDAQQLEIQTILPGALKNMDESAMGMSKAGEGLIAISWVEPIQDKFGPDDVLFEIVLKAKTNVMLSNALSVGSDFLAAEAYDKYDDVLGVSFKFNGVNETAKYELEQNMPNPFEFETSIPFVLQDASQVQVEIFDMLGNTIKKIEGRFAQGRHLIKVTSDDLNNISGMYYYQLQVAGKKPITRKMILMHE